MSTLFPELLQLITFYAPNRVTYGRLLVAHRSFHIVLTDALHHIENRLNRPLIERALAYNTSVRQDMETYHMDLEDTNRRTHPVADLTGMERRLISSKYFNSREELVFSFWSRREKQSWFDAGRSPGPPDFEKSICEIDGWCMDSIEVWVLSPEERAQSTWRYRVGDSREVEVYDLEYVAPYLLFQHPEEVYARICEVMQIKHAKPVHQMEKMLALFYGALGYPLRQSGLISNSLLKI
jgi:hypothetical protein